MIRGEGCSGGGEVCRGDPWVEGGSVGGGGFSSVGGGGVQWEEGGEQRVGFSEGGEFRGVSVRE